MVAVIVYLLVVHTHIQDWLGIGCVSEGNVPAFRTTFIWESRSIIMRAVRQISVRPSE